MAKEKAPRNKTIDTTPEEGAALAAARLLEKEA